MNHRLLGLAALLASAPGWAANTPAPPAIPTPYPVITSGTMVNAAREDPKAWDGRTVSVRGYVIAVRRTSGGSTVIELAVSSDVPTLITVISTVKPEEASGLVIAKELKVLGFLRETDSLVESLGAELRGESPVTLQAVCHQVQDTRAAVSDARLTSYCVDWSKGYVPQNLK